jgi:hypothetical protein
LRQISFEAKKTAQACRISEPFFALQGGKTTEAHLQGETGM